MKRKMSLKAINKVIDSAKVDSGSLLYQNSDLFTAEYCRMRASELLVSSTRNKTLVGYKSIIQLLAIAEVLDAERLTKQQE